MLDDDTLALAARALDTLRARQHRVVTAESCTGGLVAAALTAQPGSSDVVEGGFVTYSNALKETILIVGDTTLAQKGAVSEETAVEMVFGALQAAPSATIAVSLTGIAGPAGGTDAKPVGTVCIACLSGTNTPHVETCHFPGDRAAIRQAAVRRALELLIQS